MRPRHAMLLAVLLLPGLAAAPGAPTDDATGRALAALEAAEDARDESATIEAIRALRDVRDTKADAALLKVAARADSNRVAIEAVRALGDRGGRKNASALGGLPKGLRKRPEVLRAVLLALGATGEESTADAIARAAPGDPKNDPPTTAAAVEGLGLLFGKDPLAKLVEIQGRCAPTMEWERTHGADPPPGMDSAVYQGVVQADKRTEELVLRLTGERRNSRKLRPFHEWLNADRVARLPGHPLEITRPGDAWRWIAEPTRGFQMTAVREHEGRPAAWISVRAHSVLREKPESLEALLAERRKAMEGELAEMADASWDEEGALAGRPARIHRAAGLLGKVRVAVVESLREEGYRLVVVRRVVADGVPSGLGVEADMFLNSLAWGR